MISSLIHMKVSRNNAVPQHLWGSSLNNKANWIGIHCAKETVHWQPVSAERD
jgi:hypothetical protein